MNYNTRSVSSEKASFCVPKASFCVPKASFCVPKASFCVPKFDQQVRPTVAMQLENLALTLGAAG